MDDTAPRPGCFSQRTAWASGQVARRLTKLLLGAALLSGCGSDPGALFSTSGISTGGGSGGQRSAAAGSDGGGADVGNAGNASGGADNGGASERGGASNVAGAHPTSGGAASAGSASGGAPSAGAPSAAGAGGTPQPSACDGQIVKPDALIADFETGVAGWSGYFGTDPFSVDTSQPGAAFTAHALHFAGGKAKTSGFFRLLPCRDVSDFDGLQFWAKGKGGDLVRFLAVIPATDPTESVGDCREPAMKCSDHPGKLFTLSKEWQLYQAPWTELKQYGWGSKARFASVINAVLWINDGPVESFDFSIDEVSLYKTASR